jgi:hypothetical protein
MWPAIGPACDVSVDSSSRRCMDQVKAWLEECLTSHPYCPAHTIPSLPRRVLHVGTADKQPYLHISDDEVAEYAILSHCWGSKQPMTTTQSSIQQRQAGVPFDSLPKTFQDAVLVTRSIGLTYLWIDSLCIIQDHLPDWEIEASKMANYYKNAKITIAADGAENSEGGLFIPSPYRNTLLATLECQGPNNSESSVFIRQFAGFQSHYEINCHVKPKMDAKFPGHPLWKRAWALQEDLLSRRMLHYTAVELSWRCTTVDYCECSTVKSHAWANKFQRKLLGIDQAREVPSSFAMEGLPENSSDVENIVQTNWEGLVNSYTSRKLTYELDRLPALAGIA